MKPELLVITPVYGPTLAALEREYVVHKLWQADEPQKLMQSVAGRVRGLVTTGLFGFTREHLEALPKLEVVACFGLGHGSLDLAAANERGVIVTNTPDRTSESVADVAMGLMLGVMRRICESDRFIRSGAWKAKATPLGRELGGKTCGIVGFGGIGRSVAHRAEAFGMSICYYGPRQKGDVPYRYYADLVATAHDADCLVIACPETPQTRGLVDADVLAALGVDGFLVNVARGAIVDETALIAALQKKEIAGAGLDVFWNEPHAPQALLALDNVVLTPHIGTTTRENREERGAKLLANLRAHFSGERVLNPVE